MKKQLLFLLIILFSAPFLINVRAQHNEITVESDRFSKKSTLPAFPGAEGFGRYALGGRGGDVYYVKNLKDTGPGSLRYGIQTADGPRTILFDISGTIALKSRLLIDKSHITIAGQTAPGDGITLKNHELRVEADHVIIRFIRSRRGDLRGAAGSDAIRVSSGTNIIVDHCSASWSVDETMSTGTGTDLVTIQWCMVTESLHRSIHHKGPHGMGGVIRGKRESLHHNLYAHHNARTPKIAWRQYIQTDFRNNVIYNWRSISAYDGSSAHANWTKNYYKPGPATKSKVENLIFQIQNKKQQREESGIKEIARFYIEDNYVEGSPEVAADNWNGGVRFGHSPPIIEEGFNMERNRVYDPFPYPEISYERSPKEAYNAVLASAGASLSRDAVDLRIIEEVRNGTATFGNNGIIDSQNDVGGWPELRSTTSLPDTDGDGMPDWWEKKHGLSPNDPSNGNKDRTNDGYTNLEEYLNWLAQPESLYEDRHPALHH